MPPTAHFITHRTRPGQRDAVFAVWRKHMAPAIVTSSGHDAYTYCFDPDDPDVICAFQQYRSPEAAAAFLETPPYRAYEEEVAALLTGPPEVKRLTSMWSKAAIVDATGRPSEELGP